MKAIRIIFFNLALFILPISFALSQEMELETYYGERKDFTLDLPSEWTTALDESSSIVNILLSFSLEDPNTNVQLTAAFGYGFLSSQQKAHTKELKKQAKKRKDKSYRILDDGKGEVNGEKYVWHLYNLTPQSEDGSAELYTIKTCIFVKGTKVFIIDFTTTADQWDENARLFDSILNTLKLLDNDE